MGTKGLGKGTMPAFTASLIAIIRRGRRKKINAG